MKIGTRVVNAKCHYGTVIAFDHLPGWPPLSVKVQYASTVCWEYVSELTVVEPSTPEQLPLDIPPAI